MCFTLIHSKSNNLSIDIQCVNKGKLSGFKMSWKLQNRSFYIHFLNVTISVNIKPKYLKFSLVILRICMEGKVSQNFNIWVSSHFIKCRINAKEIITKSFLFLVIKSNLEPISNI